MEVCKVVQDEVIVQGFRGCWSGSFSGSLKVSECFHPSDYFSLVS